MSIDTTPPPAPPPPPAPKKSNVWMWLLAGCGAVLVLGAATCVGIGWYVQRKAKSMAEDFEKNPAKSAAELAVRLNPDIELVSSTDDTITVRDKKTGEVVTVNFEDAKEGKFTFKTKDGQATIDADAAPNGQGGTLKVTGTDGQTAVMSAGVGATKAPEWIPIYPGSAVAGNYDATTPEGHGGAVTITSSAPATEVMTFYKEKLEAAGFKVETLTLGGTVVGGTVVGTTTTPKRMINVVVSAADGKTQAMITFSE